MPLLPILTRQLEALEGWEGAWVDTCLLVEDSERLALEVEEEGEDKEEGKDKEEAWVTLD